MNDTKKKNGAGRCARAPGSAILPGAPEWAQMHVEVAVMVEGQRRHAAHYLRQVADSIDYGCIAGMTGDANPARGRWFSDR